MKLVSLWNSLPREAPGPQWGNQTRLHMNKSLCQGIVRWIKSVLPSVSSLPLPKGAEIESSLMQKFWFPCMFCQKLAAGSIWGAVQKETDIHKPHCSHVVASWGTWWNIRDCISQQPQKHSFTESQLTAHNKPYNCKTSTACLASQLNTDKL